MQESPRPQVLVGYEQPWRQNGAKEYALALDEELIAMGYEVFFLCADMPGYDFNLPGTKVFRLPSRRFKPQGGEEVWAAKPILMLAQPHHLSMLAQEIATHVPNLEYVIVNGNYPYGLAAIAVAKEINHQRRQTKGSKPVKTAVTLHALTTKYIRIWYPGLRGEVIARFWKWLTTRIARKFGLVVALSDAVKGEVGCKTTYVKQGVRPMPEPKETKEELRELLGIPQDCTAIICPGRLGEEKGTSMSLRVFVKAAATNPTIRLYLVGPGDLPHYQNLVEDLCDPYEKTGINIRDRIIFTDRKTRKEMAFWMEACDCGINCCPTDNAPWIVAEMLGLRRLLVGVDRAGMAQMCGPTACLLGRGETQARLEEDCYNKFVWLLDPRNSAEKERLTHLGKVWADDFTMRAHVPRLLAAIDAAYD